VQRRGSVGRSNSIIEMEAMQAHINLVKLRMDATHARKQVGARRRRRPHASFRF
jgi:hypothetical protein